jgi:hypothetical protein
MCRICTFTLRLIWSVKRTNVSIALASNIFVTAGTPILYVINLVFAHRIIRAQHPKLGWHKSLSFLARVIVVSIVAVLVLLIFAGITQSFTTDLALRQKCRDMLLFGATFYTVIAMLPLPMILIGLILPRRIRTEKFGKGRFRTKIVVLTTSTLLLTLRAVWGTTASYQTPVPRIQPIPWYYSKMAFYCVQLLPELLVVYLYAFVRVDRRFYTPTGQRNSYLQLPGIPNSPRGDSSASLPQDLKAPESAYHGYTTSDHLYQPPNYNSQTTNSVASSVYQPLHVFSEEELFSETSTLAQTLDPKLRSSFYFDQQKDKYELRSEDAESIYHYSTHHSWQGSRSNVNTRNGPGESGGVRWSTQSLREIRKVEEDNKDLGSRSNIATRNGPGESRWSTQSIQEIRKVEEDYDGNRSNLTSRNGPGESRWSTQSIQEIRKVSAEDKKDGASVKG